MLQRRSTLCAPIPVALPVALVLASLGAVACAPNDAGARSEPGLSALLITLDTTRADVLGCYEGDPALTPNLVELASESVTYLAARTVAPITQPAHASMMTGLYPPRHTVRDNGIWTLPASAETTAELARDHGLRTAAFLGSVVLDEGFGLEQGFERYDPPARRASEVGTHYAERLGSDVAARASGWLAELGDGERFFLWVHLWDPHGPYEPPTEFRGRGATPYEDEIAAADDAIGEVVEALRRAGRLADTLVVLVADHGEAFGEHDEISHGAFCYRPTLRVPFLIRHPGRARAGERSSETVSVVDVHPTLCAALELEPGRGDLDGADLFTSVVPEDRGVYFESYYGYLAYGWSPIAGWADRSGKYVHSTAPEFFGADDFAEERPLDAIDVERYREGIQAVHRRAALSRADEGIDEELRSEIQALGYVASASSDTELPHPLTETGRMDPRRGTREQKLFQQANAFLANGSNERARAIYAAILEDNPANTAALERLAICRARAGELEGAIADLSRIVAAGHAPAHTSVALGMMLAEAGREDEALESFERALAIEPNHAPALKNAVRSLRALGRDEEARELQKRLRRLAQRDAAPE